MALMQLHLFQGPVDAGSTGELVPQGGLFATWRTLHVFIVSTFSRWRVARADVVPLRQEGNRDSDELSVYIARLADMQTVSLADLCNVGVHFRLIKPRQSCPQVLRFVPMSTVAVGATQVQTTRALAALWARVGDNNPVDPVHVGPFQRLAMPRALREHITQAVERGETHFARLRTDRSTRKSIRVLDIPLPVEVRTGSWRCVTCHRRGVAPCSFPTTPQDVKDVCPGILTHQGPKIGQVFMPPSVLVSPSAGLRGASECTRLSA